MHFITSIKQRLGEFWWYSLLIFIAARSGDVVQAFIGLWLVPHYVPPSELGAILPLLQAAGAWGLPISILLVPFTKFLNIYATKGELGKVKRLLQVVFIFSALIFIVSFFAARYLMPAFFSRVRISDGSLKSLTLLVGLTATCWTISSSALQGLKKFNSCALISALMAPVRLVVMLLAMPFRALSGYMLGQTAGPTVAILLAFFGLRKELGRKTKAQPFWKEDGPAMIRYTIPVAINLVIGTLLSVWQATLIRQRLPDLDSAGYYIISRLAEVGSYVGTSLVFVVFPLAAEAHAKGLESKNKLLRNLLCGTFLAGLAFTVLFAVCGKMILGWVPLWAPYQAFALALVFLTFITAFRITLSNFTSYEMASSRFGFLWYMFPLGILETGGLGVLTGAGFFRGILPDGIINWMDSLHAARLGFFLWWFFAIVLLETIGMALHLYLRRRRMSRECYESGSNKKRWPSAYVTGAEGKDR